MLSQGNQLIRQLKQYDDLKHQGNSAVSSALSSTDPTMIDLEQLKKSQQHTSLKILNEKPKFYPPINFSLVENGIYRSGHPQPINFAHLSQLKLKTIIYLGDKTDNFEYYEWIRSQDINFQFLKMKSSEEPYMFNDPEIINTALNLIVNKDNYPILIHSNKGKHRVGVLVGVMRQVLQGWCFSGIFDEYDKFAGGKGEGDIEFIELFRPTLIVDHEKKPSFVRI